MELYLRHAVVIAPDEKPLTAKAAKKIREDREEEPCFASFAAVLGEFCG